MNSSNIKEALMHYFRFKRGWVCADEVYSGNFIGDIIVDSGSWTMEVEIKVSKSDLITGEAKKTNWGINKHDKWPIGRTNKFALCVPESLAEVAEEWIKDNNKRYGLYVYLDKYWVQDRICTKKRPLKLHNEYKNIDYLYRIAKRLSCTRAFQLSSINNKRDKNEFEKDTNT